MRLMRVIDLGEIGRPEVHAARRNRAACSTAAAHPADRTAAAVSGPLVCSQNWMPCRSAKARSSVLVVRRSADRGCAAPAPSTASPTRDFDLRQARRGCDSPRDQCAQRQRAGRKCAAAALRSSSCRRRSCCASRENRPARRLSCGTMAHRQPRAVAVAPGRAVDRRAASSPAAPCRYATGCLRARAAWPPPARAASRCCMLQPPQTPKCGQRGVHALDAGLDGSRSPIACS